MWGATGRGVPLGRLGPGLQEAGQALCLGFKNPGPEFWRKNVKDTRLARESGWEKKCLGKRPRIPRIEPDTY